jgi:hypothetical protein
MKFFSNILFWLFFAIIPFKSYGMSKRLTHFFIKEGSSLISLLKRNHEQKFPMPKKEISAVEECLENQSLHKKIDKAQLDQHILEQSHASMQVVQEITSDTNVVFSATQIKHTAALFKNFKHLNTPDYAKEMQKCEIAREQAPELQKNLSCFARVSCSSICFS